MHSQRQIAFMTFSLMATVYPVRSLLFVRPLLPQLLPLATTTTIPVRSSRRSYTRRTPPLHMAAPGVEVATPNAIRQALQDPSTTIVDARSVGELDQNGYYCCTSARWVHAEATAQTAPLLQVAASALIPDKTAPVVVYCGSGIRATTCKNVLEQQGYTNVLNAGGLADLKQVVAEEE